MPAKAASHSHHPSFDVTRADSRLILSIARRAIDTIQVLTQQGYDVLDIVMDLTACHANGCPLRLADLLESHPFGFAHDILGIHRHLDRTTGKLGDHFLPRFAVSRRHRAAA